MGLRGSNCRIRIFGLGEVDRVEGVGVGFAP